MDIDKGTTLLTNAINGFHGRFKRMYGQVSLRLDDGTYLVSAGNKQLSTITEDDLRRCSINTGDLGEIYRKCPGINSVIFGCTQDAVTVSEREESVPVTLEDLAQLTGATLRIIPDASPASIISAAADSGVCLIRGVGALAAASNPRKAVAGIQIVEKACEAEVHGEMLGGTVPMDQAEAAACRTAFLTDYTKRNESSQVAYMSFDESEFALRSQLIEHGKELVRKDLAYGSWGNISVRLNDAEMLITPSSMDYFDIRPEDIVRVDLETLDYGDQRIPSTLVEVHAAIYRSSPDCGAIIHTHSNAMSVFAACRAGFKFSEPEMNKLIGNVLITPSAPSGSPELTQGVTETMMNTHAAVIPNHGAVFTGPSLDVVFAIAEAVEMRARNLLRFDSRTDE